MGQEDPRLIRIDGEERKEFPIGVGTTRIGRSPRNDICLNETAVSRFHCYLIRDGATVLAFNDRSKNPARVDGEVAAGRRLKSGEVLEIGRCRLVYHGPLVAPAPAKQVPRRSLPERLRAQARKALPAALLDRPPVRVLAILVVSFLVLAPTGAWLIISGFRESGKSGAGETAAAAAAPSVPPPAAAPAGLEAREAALAPEIRKLLAEYKDDLRAEGTRRAEALSARIAELEAELKRLKAKDEGGTAAHAAAAVPAVLEGSPAEPLPVRALESRSPTASPSPEAAGAAVEEAAAPPGPSAGARSARTVARPAPAGAPRSLREISNLVEALCRRIDDYATLAVKPSSLEPELRDLASASGKAAAEGLLRVHDHVRRLLRATRAGMEENRRRKEALLTRAGEEEQKPPAGSGSKNEGGYGGKAEGEKAEHKQRLLELSEKAMEIQRKQSESLVRLRDAVLAAVGRKGDPEAFSYLRFSFTYETDEDLCRAILPVFEAAGSRGSIPALYHKLSGAKDPAFREAIHRTLVVMAGRDLGDSAGPWAEWWVREGKKELEQ
jgi:hypothetical protein